MLHMMKELGSRYWQVMGLFGVVVSFSGMYVLSLGEQFAESFVASAPFSLMGFIYIQIGLIVLGGVLIVVSIQMQESAAYRESAKQLEERYF